jgi:Sulfotransferase domain
MKWRIFAKMPKIFGIGLSRTGTTSLNKALEILGYKSFHFPPLVRILDIMEEYDAATDTPVAVCYPMLDKLFPGSKFILTVRDPNSWRRSVTSSLSIWPPPDWSRFLFEALLGTPDGNVDLVDAYIEHVETAVRYFAKRPEDFLVVGIARGWEPLCAFLGKAVPDVPFPHENAS